MIAKKTESAKAKAAAPDTLSKEMLWISASPLPAPTVSSTRLPNIRMDSGDTCDIDPRDGSGSSLPTIRNVCSRPSSFMILNRGAEEHLILIFRRENDPSAGGIRARESELCLVEKGRAIDPKKHFILLTNLMSGGVSSSPSNAEAPFNAARFPCVTLFDNVRLQHMLLTERLGLGRIKLVTRWSIGGCQAFQWDVQYPGMMEAIVPMCCSARTANYNKAFLLALPGRYSLIRLLRKDFIRVHHWPASCMHRHHPRRPPKLSGLPSC
jgi:hypothetical protein